MTGSWLSIQTFQVGILFYGLDYVPNHSFLGNSLVSARVISLVFGVHPHFADAFAIDANVLLGDWEATFLDLTC